MYHSIRNHLHFFRRTPSQSTYHCSQTSNSHRIASSSWSPFSSRWWSEFQWFPTCLICHIRPWLFYIWITQFKQLLWNEFQSITLLRNCRCVAGTSICFISKDPQFHLKTTPRLLRQLKVVRFCSCWPYSPLSALCVANPQGISWQKRSDR